ncbi:MAG: hypothetical protein ACM31N_05275 [Deltaproteobacteria bacterium]
MAKKIQIEKFRIRLPRGKILVVEASPRGRILKATIGKTVLRPRDFKPARKRGDRLVLSSDSELSLSNLSGVPSGKTITYISPGSAIVCKRSYSPTQTCTLVVIGGLPYWICVPPTPPC